MSSSEEIYTVDKILAKRTKNGKPEYQIKWLGYPLSQTTWEPLLNLKSSLDLVEEFEKKQSKKQQQVQKSPAPMRKRIAKTPSQPQKLNETMYESSSIQENDQNKQLQLPKLTIEKQIPDTKQDYNESEIKDQQQFLQQYNFRPLVGSYDENDSALEVIDIKREYETQTFQFKVSWKTRKNKKTPLPSWVSDGQLRENNPKVLCDFLLKKIKWPKQD